MARTLNRLTTRQVASLSKPGLHADGGGLYLRVAPGGTKRWAFVYVRKGRRREMGLGSAGREGVALADARKAALEARDAIRQGLDPIEARKASSDVPTFAMVAARLIRAKRHAWRSRITGRQWVQSLRDYAQPLRKLPVDEIGTEDVLACLKPIWRTKAETARRVRSRIEAVLDAARAEGLWAGDNPARWRGHLSALLPAVKVLQRGHHPALPYEQAPAFMQRLRAAPGVGARALEVLILTAKREAEVRHAVKAEFDLNAKLWVIPAERTKANAEDRVPLSDVAVSVLRPFWQVDGEVVFTGLRGRPISNATMDVVLKRMKVPATPHGFRSTFRDWAGDCTDYAREVAEACLAHKVGSAVERSYRRRDALEKRRALLDAWAAYLARGPGDPNPVKGLPDSPGG